jgi:hypothetical protein
MINMNQEELEKLVDDELCKMINEDSPKLLMFLVVQMGKTMVESNAGEMTLSVNSTLSGRRYKVKCVSTLEEISDED